MLAIMLHVRDTFVMSRNVRFLVFRVSHIEITYVSDLFRSARRSLVGTSCDDLVSFARGIPRKAQ